MANTKTKTLNRTHTHERQRDREKLLIVIDVVVLPRSSSLVSLEPNPPRLSLIRPNIPTILWLPRFGCPVISSPHRQHLSHPTPSNYKLHFCLFFELLPTAALVWKDVIQITFGWPIIWHNRTWNKKNIFHVSQKVASNPGSQKKRFKCRLLCFENLVEISQP